METSIDNTDEKKFKKSVLLIVIFLLTLLIFVVGTYAWFVGNSKANVNNFIVNIKTGESLQISLDGYTWGEDVTITNETIKPHSVGGSAYEDNSNSWVGEYGLIPVSSSGDNTNGKLDLYSKTAMSTTQGGYRLVSNYLDNSSEEFDYYVAFDIFIKNNDSDVYTTNYNILDDENIFMTVDSEVNGTANGSVAYGIQNSARVAFVQQGRINMDELEPNTTPIIKCDTPTGTETHTPLCNQKWNIYKTVIWEPNEIDHDTKLINYYNHVCKGRTTNIAYNHNDCADITAGYIPTYTVKQDILSYFNVDIYDGLNGYHNNIQEDSEAFDELLQDTNTFTDTMKETEGSYTLFKLAPHSVTKIRVYVYLEGQDVDNYDLITNDLNIVVNFGFTKERINTTELLDKEPRSISFTLLGNKQTAFVDPDREEPYTIYDWIQETQTQINNGSYCNDYVCSCGYSVLSLYDDRNGLNILDSAGNFVTGDMELKNNEVYSIEPDGLPERHGDDCDIPAMGHNTVYFDGNPLSIPLYLPGIETWGDWIDYYVTFENNIVKCDNNLCYVKDNGKVVTIDSWNNGTYLTDYLYDDKGYFLEIHYRIIEDKEYTTRH